jgi:ubiquinol-cytochrome c reductase cytochrome b subunit
MFKKRNWCKNPIFHEFTKNNLSLLLFIIEKNRGKRSLSIIYINNTKYHISFKRKNKILIFYKKTLLRTKYLFMLNLIRYNPTSVSLNFWWNLGSLLYFVILIQTFTAIVLVQYYNYAGDSFYRTQIIIINTYGGFIVRLLHINCVSLIFVVLYLHILKGIFLARWKLVSVWNRGLVLLLLVIIVSFFGYTLPNRSIRFWGVTVIFNLITVLPGGLYLVQWLWSGFYVNSYTIGFIFSLHFLLPFGILRFVFIHLLYLHKYSRRNILALTNQYDKIYFFPIYVIQDISNLVLLWVGLLLIFVLPYYLIDVEIIIKINIIMSPIHIQPEWYFLPYYSILRVVPRKVGAVLCFVLRIIIFFVLPLIKSTSPNLKYYKYTIRSMLFWSFCLLTWTAINPVEYPYSEIGLFGSIIYFLIITLL